MPRTFKWTALLQDSSESIKGLSIAKETLAHRLARSQWGTPKSLPPFALESKIVGMVTDYGSRDRRNQKGSSFPIIYLQLLSQ